MSVDTVWDLSIGIQTLVTPGTYAFSEYSLRSWMWVIQRSSWQWREQFISSCAAATNAAYWNDSVAMYSYFKFRYCSSDF